MNIHLVRYWKEKLLVQTDNLIVIKKKIFTLWKCNKITLTYSIASTTSSS